jgi:hypothetical protein
MRILDLRLACSTNMVLGTVLAPMLAGCFGPIPAANAQTFNSSYARPPLGIAA